MADIDYHEKCVIYCKSIQCNNCKSDKKTWELTEINILKNKCEITCTECRKNIKSERLITSTIPDMIIVKTSRGNPIENWKGNHYKEIMRKYNVV